MSLRTASGLKGVAVMAGDHDQREDTEAGWRNTKAREVPVKLVKGAELGQANKE
jgi:hypothetical protein